MSMLACRTDLLAGMSMMKNCSILAAFVFLVSASTSALAATATLEEAQRLTDVFQSYLGKEPGVVTITPAGEAYDAKIDFAPLIAKVKQPNFIADVTPLVMKLTDQGGGKWLVTQDQPLSFSANVPGQLEMTAKVGSMKGSAVFDQNIPAFTSSTTDFANLSVDETVTVPGNAPTHVAYGVKSIRYETTATASGMDAVDGTIHAANSGVIERFSLPASPASPMAMEVSITVDTATTDATIKGLKNKAVYQLIAWFVAHPSEEAIKASQSELKTILGASLPLFENMSSTGTIQNISVTTPVGPVGIASMGFDVGINGIVEDAMLHEGLTVEGLKLPPGLVPPWATDLVPNKLALDFSATDFDLASPAKILIDNADLSNPDPIKPELGLKLLSALLPKGAVALSTSTSKVTAKLYDLSIEGAMTAGPVGKPLGEATIKAKGLDQVLDLLKSAPPEMVGQSIPGLIAAKGMAKTEADGSMSWKIENTLQGNVLVNGINISKMGGG